ncbi:MAG: GNAT family N-acetyltransferase [Clostridia bacterium]|nr:GNAT family N-acetyltransferase [Clostridia bacterium]
MIKEITKAELQKVYSKNTDTSDFVLRRIKFDLDMFDNPNVDMKYLEIFDDNENYVGQGVIVFQDFRNECEFEYEYKLLNRDRCCLLKNIYIQEDYRGKGYFTLLLKEMERLARIKGYRYLILSVTKDNEKAQKVYEHLGFVKTDEEYNFSDIGECLVYMKRVPLNKKFEFCVR